MGPVKADHEDLECSNFESWWQSFKVWYHVDAQKTRAWTWPAEFHITLEKMPNDKWHAWHKALIENPEPVRRPNGRAIPLYAWWNGEKLNVIEARKQIYIPYLQRLYRAHVTYQRLFEMVRDGHSIVLIEPDAPVELSPPVNIEMLVALQDCTTWEQAAPHFGLQSTSQKYFPYGHGYVIALTLLQDLKEQQGVVHHE
jgi:hypothetical protein